MRHVAFFRTTTHRGLEIFQLMLKSEDMRLDGVLRQTMRSATRLDLIEGRSDNELLDNRIVIVDCRRRFGRDNGELPYLDPAHSNIALIEPDPLNRDEVFLTGFAEFLSWPVSSPEFFVRLLGQCRAQSLKEPQYRYSPVALVERCCVHIAADIARDVSVRALAKMLNTNHNTLNTLFNREMGLPPSAWQRKLRLEGAARQLRQTKRPVGEIAANFGYELPGNFATAFRRHFGVSPHCYRKSENAKATPIGASDAFTSRLSQSVEER